MAPIEPQDFERRLRLLQDEYFADDLCPPPHARGEWTPSQLEDFFASGGETTTPRARDLEARAASPPLPTLVADAVYSAASAADAHAGEQVFVVRLARDAGGALGALGGPAKGALVALSGGWDGSVKLWSPTREEPPRPACALVAEQVRWVYDVCVLSSSEDGSMCVATSHSGGFTGEPENVLRLWRVRGGRAQLAARPNADDGAEAAAPVHRRGVHALATDRAGRVLISASDDAIATWAVDPASGGARATQRVPSATAGVAESLLLLSDDRRLVVGGRIGARVGLPVLDASRGLVEVTRLQMRGDGAARLCELQLDGAPLVAAVTSNRALLWDVRAPQTPSLRLPLASIQGLASLGGGTTLVTASADAVYLHDLRRLPADDPSVRKAPPAEAVLRVGAGERPDAARLRSVCARGRGVFAGDAAGGVHWWALDDER